MEFEGILRLQRGLTFLQYFVSLDKDRTLACYKHINDEFAELEIYLGGAKTVIELASQVLIKFRDRRGHEYARLESKKKSLNFAITNADVGKCKFQTASKVDKERWLAALTKDQPKGKRESDSLSEQVLALWNSADRMCSTRPRIG